MEAAKQGQGTLPTIQALWKHMSQQWTPSKIGKFVNASCTTLGYTALHYACEQGNIDVVKYLVTTMKADISRTDRENRTAVYYADLHGRQATANWLRCLLKKRMEEYEAKIEHCALCLVVKFVHNIKQSAFEETKTTDIMFHIFRYFYNDSVVMDTPTPLLKAAFYGFTRLTMELWPSSQSDVTRIGEYEVNAWHLAAKQGHYLTVRALMEYGDHHGPVFVNEKTSGWDTALTIACAHGRHRVVEELVKSPEIGVNHRNDYGESGIMIACKGGHLECVRQLVTAKVQMDEHLLTIACSQGHCEVAEFLMIHGSADVNAIDINGMYPLFAAVNGNHPQMVGLLLQHGANVNVEDARGQTPLHIAASFGHMGVVHVLMFHGNLEINHQDQFGKTV